ncbi:MAG: hypothetical protein IT529_20105 [Burkholderiales bacterium]|nr:hypothetical protein [Burkholderiales bacterium]
MEVRIMAGPNFTGSVAQRLAQYRGEIVLMHDALQPDAGGSSKIERALDDFSSVAGYLGEIVDLLETSGPDVSVGEYLDQMMRARLPDRLTGCSSLLSLAVCDLRLRARRCKQTKKQLVSLEQFCAYLSGIGRALTEIADELAERIPHAEVSTDARKSADSAARLVKTQEEWEAAEGQRRLRPIG